MVSIIPLSLTVRNMKLAKYKDFESFLEAITAEEQVICLRLRDLILGNFPEMNEKFSYGAPFYHRNSRVCFLYPASLPYSGIDTGVSFGFNRGHLMSNEQGLLQMGTRKEVGYVSVVLESDIQEDIFVEMLHEAILLDDEMVRVKKH